MFTVTPISKIAVQANVKNLVLSHRMRRTLGNEKQTLLTVQKYYGDAVTFANDLDGFASNTSLNKDEHFKNQQPG